MYQGPLAQRGQSKHSGAARCKPPPPGQAENGSECQRSERQKIGLGQQSGGQGEAQQERIGRPGAADSASSGRRTAPSAGWKASRLRRAPRWRKTSATTARRKPAPPGSGRAVPGGCPGGKAELPQPRSPESRGVLDSSREFNPQRWRGEERWVRFLANPLQRH